jgi:hypothetical protein
MTVPKQPAGKKKKSLTVKQSKLLQELPKSNSAAEAGEKAGYFDRQTAHRALNTIAERTPEVLESLGLTIEYIADKCLRPLMEAKETKFFASNGIVMEEREVEALDVRLRAIEVWARLTGAFAAQKVQAVLLNNPGTRRKHPLVLYPKRKRLCGDRNSHSCEI